MIPDKKTLYRLPWSLNDNPIAWLEITDVCDIQCPCCYRQNITGHKPLDQIKTDVLFLKRWRNPDNISIAGVAGFTIHIDSLPEQSACR